MTGASLKERDRRWLDIRRELDRSNLNALLVVSDGQLERRGSLRYVSDVQAALRYGYVIFPRKGEPIGINVRGEWIKDTRALALRGGWVGESEPYAVAIVEAIRELKMERGRIGIEGDFMPVAVYRRLVQELPAATFALTSMVHELKMVKSPEELEVVARGAEMVDRVCEDCLDFARIGQTWNNITSEVCRALYQWGTEDIGGYPMSRATKQIKSGDTYHLYPEPQASGGYWMQFGRLISFGRPSRELEAEWELDMKAQDKAAEKLKPGNTGGDVMRAINDALRGSRFTGALRGSGHGVGLDIIERPFVSLDDETTLKPGMVIAVHPVFSPHPEAFEAVGDMFVITEDKPRKLSRISPEIKVV
jgi:Xaa-Pro aminopeptidase